MCEIWVCGFYLVVILDILLVWVCDRLGFEVGKKYVCEGERDSFLG